MTTVGYGDITPQTTDGKIVAVFLMLVGIGTATLLIGAVAQRFVKATVVEAVEEADAASEQDVIALVRDISERLQTLEDALHRQRQAQG